MWPAVKTRSMADRRRLERFVRSKLRTAGAEYEQLRESTDAQLAEARQAYETAKNANSLPTDSEGRAKIVCRRHTEQRAAVLDDQYRPACFDPGHPDCEGCVEDVHDGCIETW